MPTVAVPRMIDAMMGASSKEDAVQHAWGALPRAATRSVGLLLMREPGEVPSERRLHAYADTVGSSASATARRYASCVFMLTHRTLLVTVQISQ